MNIREAKSAVVAEKWRKLILLRYEEGGIVEDFCKRHGFNQSTYYKWLKRLREDLLKEQPAVQSKFVQVRPKKSTPAAQSQITAPVKPADSITPCMQINITTTDGAIRIDVDATTPPALLAQTLVTLKGINPYGD